MKTLTFIAIGAALGVASMAQSNPSARFKRAEPIEICHRALNASLTELDALNQAAGMKPGAPFSIDDYCGANCGPDRSCLDDCRSCLDKANGEEEQ